ncbi:hypothetical protein [Streptomyces sp. NPDC053431]|uniref:hypothetical protein n=1 Tax=Streptomyces sp. NPDC053431 TaxID=3365703 RepID=UPI0037D2AEDC
MSDEPPVIKFYRSTPTNTTRFSLDLEKIAAATSAVAAAGGVVFTGITAITWDDSGTPAAGLPGWFLPSAGVLVLLVTLALATALIVRERRRAAVKREEQVRVENAAERLKEHMELASLVNFNRLLLERYHGIATKQANKSFISAIVAMGVGLAVLVGAFIASMHFTAQGERLFIGSLAALATGFVGYLSKTFLAVYDRSLQQLNQYFNQPVLNQYFLTAERITDQLEGQKRDELMTQIVMDVLETGKQMHQVTGGGPKPRPKAPKIGRQRSKPQARQQR